MSVIPKEQILRLNCPGYGEESFLTLGKARALDTYSVIIANPVSILHLFDRDPESVREIETKMSEGSSSYLLKTDAVLQEIETDLKQRIFELVSFLERGGLLVYFLCRPFMVQGPASAMDNYYWLESLAPDSPAELNVRHMSAISHGRIVEATDQASKSEFANYFKQPGLEWSTIIRSDFLTEGYIVLATAGPRKCIAAHLIAGDNGGRILFLPAPYSPDFDRTLLDCIGSWNNGKQAGNAIGMGSDNSAQNAAAPTTTPYISNSQPPTMFAGLDGNAYYSAAAEPESQTNYMPPVPKFDASASSTSSSSPTASDSKDSTDAKDSASLRGARDARDSAADSRDLKDTTNNEEPATSGMAKDAKDSTDSSSKGAQSEKRQEPSEPADRPNEDLFATSASLPNLTYEQMMERKITTSPPQSSRNLLKEMESMAQGQDSSLTKPEPEPEAPSSSPLSEKSTVNGQKPALGAIDNKNDDDSPGSSTSMQRFEPGELLPPGESLSEVPDSKNADSPGRKQDNEKEPASARDSRNARDSRDQLNKNGLDSSFEASSSDSDNNHEETRSQSNGDAIPEAKDLIKKMEEMTKTVAPEWAATFSFPDLDDLRKERESLADTIRQTQSKITAIDSKLAMLDGLKNALLAADGEDLKEACSRVFKRIGWNSQQAEAEPKELVLVGKQNAEVIARIVRSSTGAPRPDVAQLAQSVLTFWGETEIEPKGLLITSTFVGVAPKDRTEPDYTDALAEFAQKKSLCLMTTLQLLCMYRDLELGKMEPEQVRNKILDTNGRLTGFELEPAKSRV